MVADSLSQLVTINWVLKKHAFYFYCFKVQCSSSQIKITIVFSLRADFKTQQSDFRLTLHTSGLDPEG